MDIMTIEHPKWSEFTDLLGGKEGCNFRKVRKFLRKSKTTWTCKGGTDKTFARQILEKNFPEIDIDKTFKYFDEHGGHCDCEILFNVNR